MRKTFGHFLIFLLIANLTINLSWTQVRSLTHIFQPGKVLLDLDGDGLPEKHAVTIIIPDHPTGAELSLASDLAARYNFESLALSFDLVRKESEVKDLTKVPFPILVGQNLKWVKEILKQRKNSSSGLSQNQGAVYIFNFRNQTGLACLAGSDEALLKTGRAFFLRWPFLWDIWGQETSDTFLSIENDVNNFLGRESIKFHRTILKEAIYEFPALPPASSLLDSFKFNQGQIKNLIVEIYFMTKTDREKAFKTLTHLQKLRQKGQLTDSINYASCANISFELWAENNCLKIALPRVGVSKTLLTPAYKEAPAREPQGKDFDLLSVYSTSGFYSDENRDGIFDGLEALIIIPGNANFPGIIDLASRLTLPTAGVSFPLVLLDSEIDRRRELAAPILVGHNVLINDLIKTGKLKPPELETASGLITVVPKAFGKSNALALISNDSLGLDKTLKYFSRTFPYFDRFEEGRPALKTMVSDFEQFLAGKKGAAEGYFWKTLQQFSQTLSGLSPEYVEIRAVLPKKSKLFENAVHKLFQEKTPTSKINVLSSSLSDGQAIFQKEKTFPWEADEALKIIKQKITETNLFQSSSGQVRVSLGLSEPPKTREKIKHQIEQLMISAGCPNPRVEVASSYKPGFFWVTETVIPALKGKLVNRINIKFASVQEDLSRPKRSYSDPARWLNELYPVDEIIAGELNLPLEKIEFEMKDSAEPTYELRAFDVKDNIIFEQVFSPRTKDILMVDAFPEWGTARINTSWCEIDISGKKVLEVTLPSDLENIWTFFQKEVLKPVLSYIFKKTGDEPTFSKQPYFKKLQIELRASEPDFKINLGEEIISSLESIHDELYFNTLDLLRNITRFDPEDKDIPEDASRLSAPGNVLPIIHSLTEGGSPSVNVVFEDWQARSPEVTVKWKEKNQEEKTKKIIFPSLKPKTLTVPALVFNGQEDRVEELIIQTEWEKEQDFQTIINLLDSYREALSNEICEEVLTAPGLNKITARLKFQDRDKDEKLTVKQMTEEPAGVLPAVRLNESIVTTREIISPDMCLEITKKLGSFKGVRSYIAGKSYEGRDVPALELFLPTDKYASIARVITMKPTLFIIARQHANEVSSTNYVLRLAELISRDKNYSDWLKKVNVVIEPMENPDGAQLAYELHRIQPFHCLHAGRYSPLGIDVGIAASSEKPILPEAAVRNYLDQKWRPDIFLNLHGYPSHEWVQQFTNYTPYLFRDYWIPKGWFTYFRTPSLPIYEKYRTSADELQSFIIKELQSDDKIKLSNQALYARYQRWATRWSPHINPLELYDNVNIYRKRRSPTEIRLTARTQITYIEQIPELMDETATGDWLEFLCQQGLAYLRAHLKFLSQARFKTARIEEEVRGRVRLTLLRERPPETYRQK